MSQLPAPWLSRGATVPAEEAEELYELAPCGYFSLTADDTVCRINTTMLEWLGLDRDQVDQGIELRQLLTGGSRLFYETHVRPGLMLNGSIREVDLDMVRADGSQLPVLLNATVAHEPDGRVSTIRVSVFDTTLRREHEEALRRAEREAEAARAAAQELARTLQAALLPPLLPTIPGLEIDVIHQPAGDGAQVGGDFYDVFQSAPGEWIIAVGDVSGKGPAAAAVTALTRFSIQAASIREWRPSAILHDVNAVLLRNPTDKFCTAVCMRVRVLADGHVDVSLCLAGHPPPLLVDGDDIRGVGGGGTLLGAFPEIPLHDTELRLRPGQQLVLFTDGLTEARRDGQLLGEDGVIRLLRQAAADGREDTVQLLAYAALEYQDGGISRDDIVVMSLRVPG